MGWGGGGSLRRGPESEEQAFEVDRTVGWGELKERTESGEQAFKTDKQTRGSQEPV